VIICEIIVHLLVNVQNNKRRKVERIEIIPHYPVQGADSKRNIGPVLPEDGTHMPQHVVVDTTE